MQIVMLDARFQDAMEMLLGPVFSRLSSIATPEHLVACVNIPPYRLVYNAELCDGKWVDWEFDAHEVRLDRRQQYWTLVGDNVWVADGDFEWPDRPSSIGWREAHRLPARSS